MNVMRFSVCGCSKSIQNTVENKEIRGNSRTNGYTTESSGSSQEPSAVHVDVLFLVSFLREYNFKWLEFCAKKTVATELTENYSAKTMQKRIF